MPKITKIATQISKPDRVSVYIDNVFCTGIRKRTFQDMGLMVGDEISCSALKEKENFFWKDKYQPTWKNEKVRLEKVSALILNIRTDIKLSIVGFGADSEEFIKEHPEEKGKPDIEIQNKEGVTVMSIEVTGTEHLKGTGYWVRPDKLAYAENHPEKNVWIILHYAEPKEAFIFIKPVPGKAYKQESINIKGAGEIMCIFNDGDKELKTLEQFSNELKAL